MRWFTRAECRDLVLAWLVLGVAFTAFLGRPGIVTEPSRALALLAVCLATAGVGFVGHELAHKLVAIRLGRPAVFRAEYHLLAVTLLSGLAGLLFAAPGAVHHRGPPDRRAHGLVAVAGPVANLALLVLAAPLALAPVGPVATLGLFGVWINALLAAFNMLPLGPLDGRTVWRWHPVVYLAVALPSFAAAAVTFTTVGLLPV